MWEINKGRLLLPPPILVEKPSKMGVGGSLQGYMEKLCPNPHKGPPQTPLFLFHAPLKNYWHHIENQKIGAKKSPL